MKSHRSVFRVIRKDRISNDRIREYLRIKYVIRIYRKKTSWESWIRHSVAKIKYLRRLFKKQ